MDAFIITALTVTGLIIGSFLNVVIVRLPKQDEHHGTLGGRSKCLSCDTTIAWYDNIPLISWIILRGKCRRCGERISVRYPLVEAITPVGWVAMYVLGDSWQEAVTGIVFFTLLFAISVIDLRIRIIPDRLSLPGTVVGIALSIGFSPDRWLEIVLAVVIATFIMMVPAFINPKGMGMGDVKLVMMMAAFLGSAIAPAMFIGFLLGAVAGLGVMAKQGAHARKHTMPFGPFLAVGGLIGWFVGADLWSWYLDTLE